MNNNMAKRLVVGRHLTIGGGSVPGSILGLSGTALGDLEIKGNYNRTSNGTLTDNNRAVFFTGPVNASITSPTPTTSEIFPYMIVDKDGSPNNTLTLNAPVDITKKLTLTSGRIITSGSNTLSITNKEPDDDANGIAYPDDGKSYVDGPIRRQLRELVSGDGTKNYLFPVGDLFGATALFRRFRLKEVTGPDNYFTGQFFAANPPGLDVANEYDFFGNDLIGIMKSEYWQVDKEINNSMAARIVVPYVNPGNSGWFNLLGNSVSPPTDPKVNVAMVHSPSYGNWEYTGTVDPPVGFDANPNLIEPEARPYNIDGELKSRVVTSFSPFSIGFGYASILPLHLLSFTAALHGPDALLHFTLAEAKDLKQFEVEHSTDGQRFNRLATIGYNGGTDYHYRHTNLPAGVHYYRLKMVEKDGRSSYSKVEVLMVNTNRTLITGLMHNPIVGGQAVVRLFSASNQDADVMVIDMAGRTLLRQKLLLQMGYNQPSLSLMLLPAGMYKMLIRTRDGVEKVMTAVK